MRVGPHGACSVGGLHLLSQDQMSRTGPRTLCEKPHWGAVRVPLMNATTRLSCT